MQHLAIMTSKLGLIPNILLGKKKIESRWYKNKKTPWNKINNGDTVYFKDSGKSVTAMAEVEKVKQFELNKDVIQEIIDKYGGEGGINLHNKNSENEYYSNKKYCILIFLKNPKIIKPFNIDKKGFGIGCAWITLEDIERIKKLPKIRYPHSKLMWYLTRIFTTQKQFLTLKLEAQQAAEYSPNFKIKKRGK